MSFRKDQSKGNNYWGYLSSKERNPDGTVVIQKWTDFRWSKCRGNAILLWWDLQSIPIPLQS
jgi:hypothetical protein